MNIIEELLQARDKFGLLPATPHSEMESLLFRAASTIQTLEQQVKDSEATATRCIKEVVDARAGRSATLRFISVITLTYWLVIDTERKLVMATCAREQDANEIAALLNKA